MIRKNSQDVLKLLEDLKKIIENKPSTETMYAEVQMMKFKVKPLRGDVAIFNLKNKKLIETLWSLGKLDELFQKELFHVKPSQREIFFKIFDDLTQKYQLQLNQIPLKREEIEKASVFEMEIFKEKPFKKSN